MRKTQILLVLILTLSLPFRSNAQTTVTGTSKISGTATLMVAPAASGSCAFGLPCTTGWYAVPNTSLTSLSPGYASIQGTTGQTAVETAWSGALVDNNRNRFVIWGGGHSDYYGNEVYAIDFNATPIAPVLVHNAANNSTFTSQLASGWGQAQLGGGSANNVPCPEAVTDVSGSGVAPNTRHGYAGSAYLPNMDAYFYYGAGLAGTGGGNCGSFTDGVWLFQPFITSGSPWRQFDMSVHPNSAGNGSIPMSAYNQFDNKVYELENNVPNFWSNSFDANSLQFTTANENWAALTGPSGAPCNTSSATSAIYPPTQLYVCLGGGSGNLYTISLANSTVVNDTASTGCSTPAALTAPGIAYDPLQNLMVIWGGGNTIYTYDPVGHTCSSVTYTGGPGPQLSNGTFTRFQYMPGLGGFVVANGTGSNVYFLRLVAGPTTPANDDFTQRCAATGVIVCDALATSAATPQRTCANDNSGLYPDTCPGGTNYASFDCTTYRSNGCSMLFTIPGLSGTQAQGYLRRGFTALYATSPGTNDVNWTHFGAGTDLYMSFSQWMDSAFITNVASTGSAATYWKQFILSWAGSTCGQIEVTGVNDNMRGYPELYSQCGAVPFEVNTALATNGIATEYNKALISSGSYVGTAGSGAYTLTGGANNGSSFFCQYNVTPTFPACALYTANVWQTYLVHIHIGTFGSPNSTVEAFVSTPTSPAWRQFVYFPSLTISLDAGNTWGFDMVTLLPYFTGRDPGTCSTPCSTAHTRYNELIVSSSPIAPPQAPPAKP